VNKVHYKKLIGRYWIVGVIDSHGAIHSKMMHFKEAKTHDELYPGILLKWRWHWDKSVDWSICSVKPTKEESWKVREHLTKYYDIPFWENGHHDIQYIMKKAGE